jgi:hypothetical protein
MASVDTTTRNGMGVSLRSWPVAAIAPAMHAPNASGSSNANRLWMMSPAATATDKIRLIVMSEEWHRIPAVSSRNAGPNLKLTYYRAGGALPIPNRSRWPSTYEASEGRHASQHYNVAQGNRQQSGSTFGRAPVWSADVEW